MDELKLKLSTKFMRGVVANLLSKAIYKKIGYNIDIQIDELEVKNEGGKIILHANLDAEVKNHEFVAILKTIGLD